MITFLAIILHCPVLFPLFDISHGVEYRHGIESRYQPPCSCLFQSPPNTAPSPSALFLKYHSFFFSLTRHKAHEGTIGIWDSCVNFVSSCTQKEYHLGNSVLVLPAFRWQCGRSTRCGKRNNNRPSHLSCPREERAWLNVISEQAYTGFAGGLASVELRFCQHLPTFRSFGTRLLILLQRERFHVPET